MLCSKGHRYQGARCPWCGTTSRLSRSGASRPELNTYAWQKQRRAVREQDGNKCRSCGSTRALSVHHHDLGGLVTLCSSCHRRMHT